MSKSMFGSWLPSLKGDASVHELPFYRDEPTSVPPPLLGASAIMTPPVEDEEETPPASIPTSPIRSPPPLAASISMGRPQPQGMTWLKRQERDLELQLHSLLDAQSDALLAGLSGPQQSSRAQSPLTVRKAIYKSIKDLTRVKSEEENLIKSSLKTTESTLHRLSSWDSKRDRLQREIDLIKQQEIAGPTNHLKSEAEQLEREIADTEQRLQLMRQRYAQLTKQIDEVENAVQSKLSSYLASLNMLEEEIQGWLARPQKSDAPFFSLPKSRRTVALAQEHWSEEYKTLDKARKDARRDKRALEQGALVWKEVATDISTFERDFNDELTLGQGPYSSEQMNHIIEKMDQVIQSVQNKLELATSKDWKLLVVCIGAELEAFKQGRDMLVGAAQQGISQDPPSSQETETNTDLLSSEYQSTHTHPTKSPDNPSSTIASRILKSPLRSPVIVPEHSDSEDEPDPARLLVATRSDTD